MQERVESDQIEHYIVHEPLDRFFINMHGFHNSHLLRATLPRDLVAPILLFPDRQAKHFELASQLREKVAGRKIALAKKRKQPAKDDENGEEVEVEARPRKRQKKGPGGEWSKKAAGKRSKKVAALPAAHSMIANREKRKNQPSTRARAAQDAEESRVAQKAEESASELEEYLESSDDDEDIYIGSDSDYSDIEIQ
jgi:hypothetical protein